MRPRESRLFAMIEALSPPGQESIPLRRMDYKANCSCLSSKAKKVRKPLLLSPESLKNFQADWSVPDGSSVTCCPLTLLGSPGQPNWLQGGTQTTHLPLLFAELLQHKTYAFVSEPSS